MLIVIGVVAVAAAIFAVGRNREKAAKMTPDARVVLKPVSRAQARTLPSSPRAQATAPPQRRVDTPPPATEPRRSRQNRRIDLANQGDRGNAFTASQHTGIPQDLSHRWGDARVATANNDRCGKINNRRRAARGKSLINGRRILRGTGRVVFVAALLLMAGTLNLIYGIAGVGNAHFFDGTQYLFSSLHTWGWITIIVALIQLTAGFSLFTGGGYGRLIGIFAASLGAVESLLSIGGAHPWWSLAIFFLCVYVLHGLIVFGEDLSTAR